MQNSNLRLVSRGEESSCAFFLTSQCVSNLLTSSSFWPIYAFEQNVWARAWREPSNYTRSRTFSNSFVRSGSLLPQLQILQHRRHQKYQPRTHNYTFSNTPERTRNIRKSFIIPPFSTHQQAPEISRTR